MLPPEDGRTAHLIGLSFDWTALVVSVQMAAEKRYELRVDGQILGNLTEADITERFRSGRSGPTTPCRVSGDTEWQNLNEFFPLLKYGIYAWEGSPAGEPFPGPSTVARPAYVARWKIGMICFAAGLLCAGVIAMWPKKAALPELPQRPAADKQYLHGFEAQPRVAPAVQSTPMITQTEFSTFPRAERASRISKRVVQETVQRSISSAPSVVSKPVLKPEEITIPLEQWTSANSTYGSFWVKIRDHGPVTISVWLNYSRHPRRIEKEKGFETTGTNIVEIYSLRGAKVYYVDRIGVSSGHCVLKIIPNS